MPPEPAGTSVSATSTGTPAAAPPNKLNMSENSPIIRKLASSLSDFCKQYACTNVWKNREIWLYTYSRKFYQQHILFALTDIGLSNTNIEYYICLEYSNIDNYYLSWSNSLDLNFTSICHTVSVPSVYRLSSDIPHS